MAPIKLEENIREQLQEREIQPSANAWNDLEAKLSKQDERRPSYLWWGVAASIAAVLIVGSLLFTASENPSNELIVEESIPKNSEVEQNIQDMPVQRTAQELASEETVSEAPQKELIAVDTPTREIAKNNEQKGDTTKSGSNAIQKLPKKEARVAAIDKNRNAEDAKVAEVVAQVKALQESNRIVSAEEVDMLLATAQKELQTARILDENTQKVDATALLQEVEFSLERSFRDKVFDALGNGFEKIRTAVAERNN
ncbi:hypothetical protein [Candidatus Ulvibacter alkanivorans]|jgi:outer membrane biosynthesis protein TonB|uniref:hypothetical protein n=1 Tax=Candidatus Ulvibacter alkanivorans TaxID=2267620 RepID=UPI000DF3C125|nr:hypothetical protein [Candidatus Ulvibacter alkanivorans]